MPLTPFLVDARDPLDLRVVVNGCPVIEPSRVSFDWKQNEAPTVFIELRGTGMIEGEGVIVQRVQGEIDEADLLLSFLSSVDPQDLEQRALARMSSLEGGQSTGEAFLGVLKDLADGD